MGWLNILSCGDMFAAFLRMRARESVDPIYMEQPRAKPLPGLQEGQLVEWVKGVFGLPDSPRACWEEFSRHFTKELCFECGLLDPAYLWRHSSTRDFGVMLVTHVDDILVSHDGARVALEVLGCYEWQQGGPVEPCKT